MFSPVIIIKSDTEKCFSCFTCSLFASFRWLCLLVTLRSPRSLFARSTFVNSTCLLLAFPSFHPYFTIRSHPAPPLSFLSAPHPLPLFVRHSFSLHPQPPSVPRSPFFPYGSEKLGKCNGSALLIWLEFHCFAFTADTRFLNAIRLSDLFAFMHYTKQHRPSEAAKLRQKADAFTAALARQTQCERTRVRNQSILEEELHIPGHRSMKLTFDLLG